jgi:hypothetical protein
MSGWSSMVLVPRHCSSYYVKKKPDMRVQWTGPRTITDQWRTSAHAHNPPAPTPPQVWLVFAAPFSPLWPPSPRAGPARRGRRLPEALVRVESRLFLGTYGHSRSQLQHSVQHPCASRGPGVAGPGRRPVWRRSIASGPPAGGNPQKALSMNGPLAPRASPHRPRPQLSQSFREKEHRPPHTCVLHGNSAESWNKPPRPAIYC